MSAAHEPVSLGRHRRQRVGHLLLWPLCLLLLAGCGGSQAPQRVAEKAKARIADCRAIGDKAFKRIGKSVVWDLEGDSLHPAHRLLKRSLRYRSGKGPVTVFLVSGKRSQQIGTYSVSRQPAYREWVDVCVVQFASVNDAGTALAAHEVVSLDPRRSRPVQPRPEHGDPAPPLAEWIRSLPTP